MILAGTTIVFTAGLTPAQASHHAHAPTTTTTCTHQHNLNDPTNSHHQALSSYSFLIEHGGTTASVCDLFPNVKPGDIVTVKFTAAPSASPGVTLVSYQAPPSSPKDQTLFECASFGVTDSCPSSTSPALTVHVPNCGFQVDFIYGAPAAKEQIGAYAAADVWISGMAGDRQTGTCPGSGVGGTTATPTPITSTSSGGGSGVLGASVGLPNTGAGAAVAQSVLGLMLIVLGAGLLVRGGRSRREDDV
jgi:LPXTG-motif cell wall-anchored protein